MNAMSNAHEKRICGRLASARRHAGAAGREHGSARERIAPWLTHARRRLVAWWDERCSRRALSALPDHILEDIGFRRVDAFGRGRWRDPASNSAAGEMLMPISQTDDLLFTIRRIEDGAAAPPDVVCNAANAEILASSKETSMTTPGTKPAIARIWRGYTKPERADAYESYLHDAGIKPLMEKALGVQLLREDRASESEFVTISYWESIEAMSRFTGGDPKRIHHLPHDTEFLIELPERVQILEIRTTANLGLFCSSPVRLVGGDREIPASVVL